MSRIQQALQRIQPFAGALGKLIEDYIQSGDRKILARIQASKANAWDWVGHGLASALARLPDWTDQDRRVLHVIFASESLELLGDWFNDALTKEKPKEDIVAAVRAELASCGATTSDFHPAFSRVRAFARDGKPTSAGRYVLGLADPDLGHVVQQDYSGINLAVLGFLIDSAPDRIPSVMKEVSRIGNNAAAVGLMLRKGGKRFEHECHGFFQSMTNTWQRFLLGQVFFELDSVKYRNEALLAARASLAGSPRHNTHGPVGEWMVEKFGIEALPDLVHYLASPNTNAWSKIKIVAAVARSLKNESLPALHAAIETNDPELALSALPHLIAIRDDSQDKLILQTLERGFQDKSRAVRFITQAAQWKVSLVADSLWGLLSNKSKPVRDAAARALARLGDVAAPRAGALLLEKKADNRAAAVTLLTSLNSESALELLEKHVDHEPDEDVRDSILLGLEAGWAARGRTVSKKEVDARIARVAEKLKELPAGWIDEGRLPALKFNDGKPLVKEAVRYLLYRQSRAKGIRPDVEAKPLYGMIDRETSGDFAIEILKQFLASNVDAGDRWALSLAGLLGDDRITRILNQQIRQWVDSSRGKMAEYAVEALSLLGTDAALLTIDALAIRYRTKNKNVGQAAVNAFAAAAENLGITPDELGDRVVPWLGFEPGQPRIIDCGGKKIEARISTDLKLKLIDLEKKKPVASLPKTAPEEVLAEFKELGATLREVVKAQVLRLENLMVRQQRWSIVRWRELFTMHPVLLPMAVRLIWGVYDDAGTLQATFRPLEDRTLTQAKDDRFELSNQGRIGIVHPLELSEDGRRAWQTHLADYEIIPPFPQLERPVVQLPPDRADQKDLTEYAGVSLNGMTFKGRADRLGWTRGSVCDGGGVPAYFKDFRAAGVDAFLGLEGMYIGIDMSAEIKLQDAYFVRSGSVKTGSYTYDEPADKSDIRVLRFGDVPPIVYSEVLGDLQKIAGKKEGAGVDDA